MTGRMRRRRASLGLAILCAGLAGVVYAEWRWAREAAPEAGIAEATPAPIPPLPPALDYPPPAVEDFAETLARPLFAPSRRAAEAEAVVEAPGGQALAVDFALVGVVISPEDRHALILQPGAPALTRVAEGGQIAGWLVEVISPDRVTVRSGEAVAELRLRDDLEPASGRERALEDAARRRRAPEATEEEVTKED